jgi:heme exporter protein D/c-di-GMP-binding flagellar brake protein YcgR
MFIFNPEKVSEFLDNIASGFQHRPWEVLLFFVLILLFVVFLLSVSLIQRRKVLRQRLRQARERYERAASRLGLTPEEGELVERLAAGLKGPDRLTQVLVSSAAFNRAVDRLGGGADPAALAELRMKLGFRAQNPESVPTASSELPEGLPVLLVRKGPEGTRQYGAVVRAQEPEALVLEVTGAPPTLARGQSVTVVLQNRAGLFSFASAALSLHGSELRLEHSEHLQRTQRRRYYRRQLSLPVQARRVALSGGSQPTLEARLLDLGGEGASMRNPGAAFAQGDELELRFRLGGEPFELEAEVLRLSRGGQVLHVRFRTLREATRDRILRALFQHLGEAGR